MSRDRAAYMRDYRAKKAVDTAEREMGLVMGTGQAVHDALAVDLRAASARIAELEAEVARLKRELASRPPIRAIVGTSFGFPRPAPKPGHK